MSKQIYWNDGEHIHACDSSIVLPRIRLVWTRCLKDVPANAGYRVENGTEKITCGACLTDEERG